MRFGLILPTNRPEATVQLIRESAALAEELGYDSIWTTDHVMMTLTSAAAFWTRASWC